MKHDRTPSPERLAKLKKSKDHWANGAPPVSMSGVRQMEFKPLVVKEHPRQADIDSFRAVRSLVT